MWYLSNSSKKSATDFSSAYPLRQEPSAEDQERVRVPLRSPHARREVPPEAASSVQIHLLWTKLAQSATGDPKSGHPGTRFPRAPSSANPLPVSLPSLGTGASSERSTAKHKSKPPTKKSNHAKALSHKIQSSHGVTPSFEVSRG